MEASAILLAALSALAGPAASVKVASFQAARALDDLGKRLSKIEERVQVVEHLEPETQAKLRHDLDALAKDVSTVRTAVEHLRASHEKGEVAEEKRREKAAERAERREERERADAKELAVLVAKVEQIVTSLQELRHARTPK